MANLMRLLLSIYFYCACCTVYAADQKPVELNESQIKAIYLYKFSAHVEWPQSAFSQDDSPFVIGIIGSEEVAAELSMLSNGQQLNNRTIRVRTIKIGEVINDVHVLFIDQRESNNLEALLTNLQLTPVLIVTEKNGALSAGSIINFVPVDDHIRFEISLISADINNLKISSRLLSVAQKIEVRRP
jgi:hypothetical protein